MLTPKTFWAVICITHTRNNIATMFTGKIFNFFLEFFHYRALLKATLPLFTLTKPSFSSSLKIFRISA